MGNDSIESVDKVNMPFYCVPEDYFETFTVDQVADKFSVGDRIAREWISSGELRAKKIGRQYFITKAAVKELLNSIGQKMQNEPKENE